jgi:ribosomal protein S18 acetylase RimI-like enzyme
VLIRRVRDAGELDAVEPLFRGMVEHHRLVAGTEWPVRESGEAWRRRRAQYEGWLAGDGFWLLLAVDDTGAAIGYAALKVIESGPTWDLGERIAELESLAVAEDTRGSGVGAELMRACREQLRAERISYWEVGVVETNAGAVRFYEREGFRRYYRYMLADV